jgi:hypothetical protein
MLRKSKFLLLICYLFLLNSCLNSDRKNESVVKEWISKEVVIPKNIIYKSIGTDTISKYIFNHSYKILVYVDSVGCSGCRLGLVEWKAIIDRCQSKGYDVGFLFVVQSSDYFKFEEKLEMKNFTYPIIYDIEDNFNRLNKFPKENKYRTFLLDKDNKVVLIGSPILSDKVWELYFNILSKTKNQVLTTETYKKLLKNITSVSVDQDSVNLGKFKLNTKQIPFKVTNNGLYPLIIQNVSTSCGCTVAKYEKKPINKGESTTVVLEYKPNSLGYFSKTADVVCNVPEGFVRLKISGEVIE